MTFKIKLRPIQFGAADGDRFEVFPVVTNPTNATATDTVELLVGGTVRDSRNVTLSAGGEKTVKLVWNVSIESNQELSVTVNTGSDSASDEATFRLFNDVVRVRFDADTRAEGVSHNETFVEDTEKVGAGAE